jgi:hypothetical protein
MTGYIRCVCCNQPLPVTAEDIGLTVTCPRTGRMVMVRASDVQAASRVTTKPATQPCPPVPKPQPQTSTTSHAANPKTAQGAATPNRPSTTEAATSRRWVAAVVLAVLGVSVLAAVVLAIHASRPDSKPPGEEGTVNRVEPAPIPLPSTAPTDSAVSRPSSPVTHPTKPIEAAPSPIPAVTPPTAPRTLPVSLSQVGATYRWEVVRVNHPKNCVLCHTPSFQQADLVRGAVPDPRQPLPPPTTPAYYERGGQFVTADTTYLRQDFSVVQPVIDSGNWPKHQRFDYFVTLRKVDSQPAVEPSPDSPYRKAVGFALRELSGHDPEQKVEWLAAQKRSAISPQDTRLAEVARLVSLQTNPKALAALAVREFAQPLLTVPSDELDKVVKGLQEAHGEQAVRTAFVAYLDPLTRTGDAAIRRKAAGLLAVVLSSTPDADLPAKMRTAVEAPVGAAPISPAALAPARDPGPTRPPKDRRGLPIHSLPKRLDVRKMEELEKELLGVREIALDQKSGTTHSSQLVSLAKEKKDNGQPYPGAMIACEGRADLAGLPFCIGLEATLTKEKAEALHALSKALRETVQACTQLDDPRPNTDDLYAALLSGSGGRGFRHYDPKKWATAEAVPCIQQILEA